MSLSFICFRSDSISSATYSVVTRRKRRLAAEKTNVREESSANADTAIGLAAASGDQSLPEPSSKQRKEATVTDNFTEGTVNQIEAEEIFSAVSQRAIKDRRAKTTAHNQKGKKIRQRHPALVSSDSDQNETQSIEARSRKKRKIDIFNLAESETSSTEHPPSSSPTKHLEKRSASLEEQSICSNSGGQSIISGTASATSQKRNRRGKEKLSLASAPDATSDLQSGETSRIRRRLNQLTDHLPEVRVPSFRRITRGFAKYACYFFLNISYETFPFRLFNLLNFY